MRLTGLHFAAALTLALPGPLAAQYEPNFDQRAGFGREVHLRRPDLKSPLIGWDVTLTKNGDLFWAGPMIVSLDNRWERVSLTQSADCGYVIIAMDRKVAPLAGAQTRVNRDIGSALSIELRLDRHGDQPRYRFAMALSGSEPAPDAKGSDQCEIEPWRYRHFSWDVDFADPGQNEFEIKGREGFAVYFRRRTDG